MEYGNIVELLSSGDRISIKTCEILKDFLPKTQHGIL